MTCEPFKVGDVTGFICSRGKRAPRCQTTGCDNDAAFACDFPLTGRKRGTCDRRMCSSCRVNIGEDLDYCPPHANQRRLVDESSNSPADLGWRPEHRGPQPPPPPPKRDTMTRRNDPDAHPECTHGTHIRWADLDALAIDTETTGPDPEECAIVELGAYQCPGVDGYATPDAKRFGMLLNPGRPIPAEATAIHGITNEAVATAPTMVSIADRFLARVRAADLLVAYNWRFDARILERSLGEVWRRAIVGKVLLDPLDLVRTKRVGRFWKGKGRHKLDAVARRFNVVRGGKGNHRASSDAQVALGVLYRLADKLPSCAMCAQTWLDEQREAEDQRFEEWKRANPLPDPAPAEVSP